jgi:hypothetical protein
VIARPMSKLGSGSREREKGGDDGRGEWSVGGVGSTVIANSSGSGRS